MTLADGAGGTLDELLAALAAAAGDGVLLWRGDEPTANDVDLLVATSAAAPVRDVLAAAGLQPRAEDPLRTVWSDPRGALVDVDVMDAAAWAPYYPTLGSVRSRARPGRGGLPVAAAEDRLLMLAAEAVAGRPLEKVVRKATALIDQPGARTRVAAVGAAQGAADLAALVSRPADLERLGRDGRLPYGEAARLAARSRLARAALRARVAERVRAIARRETPLPAPGALLRDLRGAPSPLAGREGRIVAFSGMDGSGKSTLVETVRLRLEAQGEPVELAWVRVASEGHVLARLAAPVKRLLRRRASIADPVAAADRAERDAVEAAASAAPAQRAGGGPVAWAWVLVVAGLAARGFRRAGRRRRAGATVMCDRWLTDALVDLELRYGRHRAAEALLRALAPRADLALLLRVDAQTAALRKPGDQSVAVLERMERLYAEKGRYARATVIDAGRPPGEVAREALAAVDGLR